MNPNLKTSRQPLIYTMLFIVFPMDFDSWEIMNPSSFLETHPIPPFLGFPFTAPSKLILTDLACGGVHLVFVEIVELLRLLGRLLYSVRFGC